MITRVWGEMLATRRVIPMPLKPGISTSRIRIVGLRRSTSAMVSGPSVVSPTIRKAGSASSKARSPCRTMGWSSASTMVVGISEFRGLLLEAHIAAKALVNFTLRYFTGLALAAQQFGHSNCPGAIPRGWQDCSHNNYQDDSTRVNQLEEPGRPDATAR